MAVTSTRGSQPSTPRGVAAEIVRLWLETGDFPDRSVDAVGRDRGFVTEVVFGTVKYRRVLDFVIRQVAERAPERALRAYLLTGLYQLWCMGGADYAVVNETVAAVRGAFGARQAGFVNAVLRRVLRERAALEKTLAAQKPGLRLSHPDALFDRWVARYGEPAAIRLGEWDNQPPPLVLRIDPSRGSMKAFLSALAPAGVDAGPHPACPDRYVALAKGIDVRQLPGYEDGWFVVQDPSTAGAVELLDPQPGEAVLDACAAPGGKTVAIAERMKGAGCLVAIDLHADRLPALRDNLERTRQTWVTVREADVTAMPADAVGPYDGVLIDVPCSNTGVLRRRPDARWRFSLERLGRLNNTQQAILGSAAGLVRPGGRIVYSTCSLEPEEDEMLVNAWVASQGRFVMVAERRSFPPKDGADGAYAALLRDVGGKA